MRSIKIKNIKNKEEFLDLMSEVENSDVWHDPGTGCDLHFNEEGKFVTPENEPFPKGFKNDDHFGDWLHSYVERQMEKRGLITSKIPEGGSPIWYTPNAFNSPEKLLILICGAGRIHAGLFSVGVCAYHGLSMGSDLPWIDYALSHNMEVVILNPNHEGSSLLKGQYSEEWFPILHSIAVFDRLIIPGNPNKCYIVAHSMGGESVCSIGNRFQNWFYEHVQACALTDACEDIISNKEKDMNKYCDEHMIDWVCSKEEINKELPRSELCPQRSAGTLDHPLSTGLSMPYILEFFKSHGSED